MSRAMPGSAAATGGPRAPADERLFVVRGNASASGASLAAASGLLGALAAGIGLAWWWQGLPLIAPFAGLEAGALALGLYWCHRRSRWQEVVRVRPDRVVVEAGYGRPQYRHEFERAWVRVVWRRGPGWYPGRLLLRSHGREVEVGRALTEGERKALGGRLAMAIAGGRPTHEEGTHEQAMG